MTQARDKANIPVLNFASKGIDDNATSTAITINSSEQLLVGTTDAPSSTNTKLKVHVPLNSSGADAIEISHVTTGSDKPGASLGLVIGNNGSSTNAADLTFKTASGGSLSEAIRINSSGELLQGTTSPGYPEYGDNITLAGSGHSGLTIRSGTSSQGTMYFSDDTGTSAGTYSGAVIYKHNTNSMHFRTNSIDRVAIDSSGNVGIGGAAISTQRLAINGDGSNIIGGIEFRNAASGGSTASIGMASGTSNALSIAVNDAANMVFKNSSGTERMRITSAGNVGIGTTSPTVALEVYGAVKFNESPGASSGNVIIDGSATGNPQLRYYQNGTAKGYLTYWDSTDTLALTDGSANGLHFKPSNGRVGIGTSNPAENLQVSDTASNKPQIRLETSDGGNKRLDLYVDGSIGTIASDQSSQSLAFRTSGSERMRIMSGGTVLVATTNVLSASNTTDTGVQFEPSNIWVTSNGASALRLQRLTSTGLVQTFYYSGSLVGNISVTASATSFNSTSDYRLKENVDYDFDATTRLKQLKPARFNFIVDADKTVDGFLAHEVSNIVPEAITGTKDAVNEDGTPDYQGIDQSKLVPLLVKTIQELEARITTLEANNP